MSRSNCIIFALLLYFRRRRKGREGYIKIRATRLGKFGPHMLYEERRATGSWRTVSYKPINPRHKKVPPPRFNGYVAWGD